MTAKIEAKVQKYEEFVNERLRKDLQAVNEQRDKVLAEIAEYVQLKDTAAKLLESNQLRNVKTQIDLGCSFYVNARIDDASKLFVKVGLGFFVELTLAQAQTFCDKKIAQLNENVAAFDEKAAHINAYIQLVLEGLRELQHIQPTRVDEQQRRIVF